MANEDLKKYIKNSIKTGADPQEIIKNLKEVGWSENIIQSSFSEALSEKTEPQITIPQPIIPEIKTTYERNTVNHILEQPKFIRILRNCIILKFRFLYLMILFTAIFIIGTLLIIKINRAVIGSNPINDSLFFILFIMYMYILILLDKRSILYLNKRVRRAKLLIIISNILTIPVALFFLMAEGIGRGIGNEILRQMPFIFFVPPVAIFALLLIAGSSIVILISLIITFSPSFKNYLNSQINYKDKIALGASGFWMSNAAKYIGYIFLAVILSLAIIDTSGIYCLGVANSPIDCFAKKAISNHDISFCKNSWPNSLYCYGSVIRNSNYDFSLCSSQENDDESIKCFGNFGVVFSKENSKEFGGKYIEASEEICHTMKSIGGRDACYNFFAKEKKQSKLCNLIISEKVKNECKSLVDPTSCIPELNDSVEDCWIKKAYFLNDVSFCEKANHFQGNRCFYNFAMKNEDPRLCDKVNAKFDNGSGYTPNGCYLNIARGTKNSTLCEKIVEGDRYITKNDCLEQLEQLK